MLTHTAFSCAGITHLAVTHFERVLKMVDGRMQNERDPEEREWIRTCSVAWEAAHNLVLIYTASGSLQLVREVSDKWLALMD